MSQSVTDRNSALCNADLPAGVAEREIGSEPPESLHSAITDGDERPTTTGEWLTRFGDYFTPPELLSERRPAVDTMREYARRGRYTADLHGAVRALGNGTTALFSNPANMALSRLYHIEALGQFTPEATRVLGGASVVDSITSSTRAIGVPQSGHGCPRRS